MRRLGRRRVLLLAAAAAGVGWPGWGESGHAVRWVGSALGAEASLTLHHPDRARAQRLAALALGEVDRLDRIFSLQRADSSLSQLNRDGRLARPPADLTIVLELAARVSALSAGAFDVTVQPLWRALAQAADGRPQPGRELARAAALVDWRALEVERRALRFRQPGMAITLNGIAQGYITDRIADLLRDGGLDQALVSLGETRALGRHPAGRDWLVATDLGPVRLADDAVAVSGPPPGTASACMPGLLDPRAGRQVAAAPTVVVQAPRAALADALSTALAVADAPARAAIVAALPALRARAWLG